MHVPGQIDVKYLDELVAAVGVCVSANRREQDGNSHVVADGRVGSPLSAEVGDAGESGAEGVTALNANGAGLGESLASENAE